MEFAAARRRASSRASARSRTAAAPASASSRTRRSSARAPPSSRRALFRMARSKAYLFGGVEIRWSLRPALHHATTRRPRPIFHFPGGLQDYLRSQPSRARPRVTEDIFAGRVEQDGRARLGRMGGRAGSPTRDGFLSSYCNTIPTAGGRHARGRPALGAQQAACATYGERVGNKRAASGHRRRRAGHRAAPCSRSSSASPSSRARPRTSWRPGRPPASSRARCATPSTTGWRIAHSRPTSCSTGPSTSAEERLQPQAREGDRPRRPPRASCGCPASSPTAAQLQAAAPRSSSSRATSAGGSAKQARDRETPGGAAAARQDPQRRQRLGATKLAATSSSSDLIQALGCGTRRAAIATRICATSASSS